MIPQYELSLQLVQILKDITSCFDAKMTRKHHFLSSSKEQW